MPSIFTRIRKGELPGHFIWKDDLCFAILTIHPIREGHVILIPNAETDHWDDVTPEVAAHLMQVAQHLAKGIKAVIPCARVGMTIVGLEVPHTHIHVVPLDRTADLDFSYAKAVPAEQLAATAARLREALLGMGYTQAWPD